MTLFAYQCEKCKHIETEFRKREDLHNPKECPKCKGDMKLKIMGTSFKFVESK